MSGDWRDGATVAIKKVLQDRRYKNLELQLMCSMDHPNVISLKHCFFSTTSRDELFLNLVMEYVAKTVYRVLKHYSNANHRMPLIFVKLYMYQIFRGLAYIHTVPGVSYIDVKPQNLLGLLSAGQIEWILSPGWVETWKLESNSLNSCNIPKCAAPQDLCNNGRGTLKQDEYSDQVSERNSELSNKSMAMIAEG